MTDHQAFILFNLYGPAISSEENAADRFAYKLQFYKVMPRKNFFGHSKPCNSQNKQSKQCPNTHQILYLCLSVMQALEVRINALRKRGRRIVVTGDLNIAPAHIDSCEPGEIYIIHCSVEANLKQRASAAIALS